jgi:opacity protein-like surface antigen
LPAPKPGTDFTGATTGLNIRADRLSLDGYYTFNADGKFSPYVLLGAGQGRTEAGWPGLQQLTPSSTPASVPSIASTTKLPCVEAREVFNSDEDLNDAVAMLGLEFSPGAVAPLLPSAV